MVEIVASSKKTIKTRGYSPTNTMGARIKAWTGKKVSVTIPYDYFLSGPENHIKAALKLAERLDLHGKMIMGICDDCRVFVFYE